MKLILWSRLFLLINGNDLQDQAILQFVLQGELRFHREQIEGRLRLDLFGWSVEDAVE
jgi:hypothetical protein